MSRISGSISPGSPWDYHVRALAYLLVTMSHPKLQHYVPQFLLRGFTRGKKKRIHVFDKQTSSAFATKPSKIAAENQFYDVDVEGVTLTLEPWLSALESTSARILDRIRSAESLGELTAEDRAMLSAFIAIQHMRTRHFRSSVQFLGKVMAEQLTDMGADPNNLKEQLAMDEERVKVLTLSMMSTGAHDFGVHIFDKEWLLTRTVPSVPYIISDNPVTLHNQRDFGPYGNIGFAVPGIQIQLPVSDTLSLYLICPSITEEFREADRRIQQLWRLGSRAPAQVEGLARKSRRWMDALERGAPLDSTPENVQHHNSLQVLYAERWVFSPIDDFSLAERMIRENKAIRTGPRPSVS